ncbi:MAG TPA: hypothetical protein VGL89_11120 [Candidatus Koribacter sp.]|jgi:hypothetical protein
MKLQYVLAFALGAALTAAPSFAQDQQDKTAPDATKAHQQAPADKDKAAKPAETDKSKSSEDRKSDARDNKMPQSDKDMKADKDKDRHDASRMPQSDQEPAMQDDKDKNKDKDAKDREMKDRDNRGGEHQVNDRDRNAHFTMKSEGRDKVRSYYKSHGGNHDRSVTITRQEVLPVQIQTVIQPVPMELVGYLGPAPDGFQYGFADGYVFVYDPTTFFVIDVFEVM